VKIFSREAREVYRVYDAEEFLCEANVELAGAGGRRGGLMGMAGGLLLVVGMVGVFTGLLIPDRRSPTKRGVMQLGRGSRELRASLSVGRRESRSNVTHSKAIVRHATDGVPRKATPTVARQKWTRARVTRRPSGLQNRPLRALVDGRADERPSAVSAADVSDEPRSEFGFER
jgi:hypothetical protein